MPLLVVLSIACFVSALSIRILDPVIPGIARDLAVSVETAALLTSAFSFPYALSQLPAGTLGDSIGKARIIKMCLAGLTASLALSMFADSFTTLLIARVIAGASAGGIITLTFALIGDSFPLAERQIALSRVLMAMLTSSLFGAVASGFIADHFGWRTVIAVATALVGTGLVSALVWLPNDRPTAQASAQSTGMLEIAREYRAVLRHPLAFACYFGVFTEGVMVFGFVPYLAGMLEARGMGGLREAGIVIAGMGLGGIVYTFSIRKLLDLFGRSAMMRYGGVICAAGLMLAGWAPTWPLQTCALFIAGLGFYPVHNSIQANATELSQTSRGKAMAMHAASFFLGQACGPIVYRVGFATIGIVASFALAGVGMLALAFWLAGQFSDQLKAARPAE